MKPALAGAGPERQVPRPPSADDRYSTLDGLRGFSAVIIALHHFWPAAAQSAYFSLDLFFALSGFVMVRTYEPRFGKSMGTIDFIKRRLIRFLPLYWVGLVIGLLLYGEQVARHVPGHIGLEAAAFAFMTNIVMMPSLATGLMFPFNLPAWSLFCELVVNVAMVLWLWRLRTGSLVWLGLFSGLLMAALATWHNANMPPPLPNHLPKSGFDAGAGWEGWYIGLARANYSFLVGMVIGRMVKPKARPYSIIAVLTWIMLLTLQSLPIDQPHRFAFDLSSGLLIPPVLMLLGVYFDPPPQLQGVARWFGDVSFGLYMVHFPLTFVFGAIRVWFHLPNAIVIPLFLVTAVVGGWLALEYIDIPLRRRMSAWLLPRKSPAPAPAPSGLGVERESVA